MITITLPESAINNYRVTSKWLESLDLKTGAWSDDQWNAFREVSEKFGLSDAESDEIAAQLGIALVMRVFKTAIQERKR